MTHCCFYFSFYTVVIHSQWFLHRCHTFTSGSYTISHSDSDTVSFYDSYIISLYDSYTIYHFILLSYTICLLVLRFLYHCYCFRFLYHCYYSWVLNKFFLPIMSYLQSVLIPMIIEFSYPQLYQYNSPSRIANWPSLISNVLT